MAIGLIRRALELCHRAGAGGKELWNIQNDTTLDVLSSRKEFYDLRAGAAP